MVVLPPTPIMSSPTHLQCAANDLRLLVLGAGRTQLFWYPCCPLCRPGAGAAFPVVPGCPSECAMVIDWRQALTSAYVAGKNNLPPPPP